MALLWCDGFDHYGTTETFMLDGAYAAAHASGVFLSTTHVATGTHAIELDGSGGAAEARFLRKVLPAATAKMGAAARFYFPSLPNNGTLGVGSTIFAFMPSAVTTSHVSCIVDPQGAIRFFKGCDMTPGSSTGTLIAVTDPILVASAFNHVEIQINCHATLGWIRVAVNGVHRYEATGLDTNTNADNIYSVGQIITAGSNEFWMDDLIYYDFTGNSAVDTDWCPTTDGSGVGTNYIAELQCMYLPPNGDTAETDWVRSAGATDYENIDEVTPNDADYISSTTAGDLSEFDLTDLPEDITYIRGLQLLGRMSKSDSGMAKTTFGMNSDGTTDDADERPLTVAATYWWDFMNVDPDSSARWTRTSLNAAKFRLTRTV